MRSGSNFSKYPKLHKFSLKIKNISESDAKMFKFWILCKKNGVSHFCKNLPLHCARPPTLDDFGWLRPHMGHTFWSNLSLISNQSFFIALNDWMFKSKPWSKRLLIFFRSNFNDELKYSIRAQIISIITSWVKLGC